MKQEFRAVGVSVLDYLVQLSPTWQCTQSDRRGSAVMLQWPCFIPFLMSSKLSNIFHTLVSITIDKLSNLLTSHQVMNHLSPYQGLTEPKSDILFFASEKRRIGASKWVLTFWEADWNYIELFSVPKYSLLLEHGGNVRSTMRDRKVVHTVHSCYLVRINAEMSQMSCQVYNFYVYRTIC